MKSFLDLLRTIKQTGKYTMDRTGVGRHRIFGTQTRYSLADGTLPVVTTRKIFTDAIVKELLWFISGSYNSEELKAQGVKIWDQWTVKPEHITAFIAKHTDNEQAASNLRAFCEERYLGTIGEMYGAMWRNAPRKDMHSFWPELDEKDLPSDKLAAWKLDYEEHVKVAKDKIVDFKTFCKHMYYSSVDQLNELMVNLRKRPYSSRLVVNAWIPSHIPFEEISPEENVLLDRGALAPCHVMFQCFATPPEVEGGKPKLSLMMTQRSVDTPVGACYNIAQYSLLLALIAHCSDMEPDEFIWSTGDTHIYSDQMHLVDTQLERKPFDPPKLWINPEKKDLFSFTFDDIKILDYVSHPHIPYPVAK